MTKFITTRLSCPAAAHLLQRRRGLAAFQQPPSSPVTSQAGFPTCTSQILTKMSGLHRHSSPVRRRWPFSENWGLTCAFLLLIFFSCPWGFGRAAGPASAWVCLSCAIRASRFPNGPTVDDLCGGPVGVTTAVGMDPLVHRLFEPPLSASLPPLLAVDAVSRERGRMSSENRLGSCMRSMAG
ncbi:hypothetical protein BDV59DRAFT_139948 [Aspergillus ambiguus]|uniref:uncharacterized protein n=1 Tax=Aspergillus ambiguus TaxID=176160 RepID=UPI003CCDEC3A